MSSQPVILVSGDDEYRRRKKISRMVGGLRQKKWAIQEFEGEDHNQLVKVLSGSSLFRPNTLALIRDADKVDESTVLRHLNHPVDGVILILILEGLLRRKKGPFYTLAQEVPVKSQLVFKLPDVFKQAEDAAALCVQEAQERGKKLSSSLAAQMVAVTGPNLDFLSNEVLKLSLLLDSLSETEITSRHVAATITSLDTVSVFPLLEAIGRCSLAKTASSLDRIERSHREDPTIKVVRIMVPTISKWVAASLFHEREVDPEDAASQMGIRSSWYYKTKILPPAKRWGSSYLMDLFSCLVLSERSVFDGVVAPWTGLCARLLQVVQVTRGARITT